MSLGVDIFFFSKGLSSCSFESSCWKRTILLFWYNVPLSLIIRAAVQSLFLCSRMNILIIICTVKNI